MSGCYEEEETKKLKLAAILKNVHNNIILSLIASE